MAKRVATLRTKLLWLLLPTISFLSVLSGGIVYRELYGAILARFEAKLVMISALVGVLIDPTDHDRLAAAIRQPGFSGPATERSAPYRREIAPMRAVRRKLGLTYLYTQVLGGSKNVMYVLDGTEGPEHTTVGYQDQLPIDTVKGLRALNERGQLYISPIEKQQVWGLLKTAAAPVWSPDGSITGSVGADVNIEIIRESTENALLTSGLLGGLSMLLAAGAVSLVVGRVSRPLTDAKFSSLQIAVGRLDLVRSSAGPSELGSLNATLGAMAAGLERSQIENTAAAAVQRALRSELLLLKSLCARATAANYGRLGVDGRGILTGTSWTLVAATPAGREPLGGALWQEYLIDLLGRAEAGMDVRSRVVATGGCMLLWSRSDCSMTALGGPLWIRLDSGEHRLLGEGEQMTAPSACFRVIAMNDDETLVIPLAVSLPEAC